MTSEARVKCVPNTMIIGVGCGNSYSISNPTRSFIRFPLAKLPTWLRSGRSQGFDGLFGRERQLALQKRGTGEKTIANCGDCAHGADNVGKNLSSLRICSATTIRAT